MLGEAGAMEPTLPIRQMTETDLLLRGYSHATVTFVGGPLNGVESQIGDEKGDCEITDTRDGKLIGRYIRTGNLMKFVPEYEGT